MLFCRIICDFWKLLERKIEFLSKGGLRILWGPSNRFVYVHLIVEVTDTLEMTDCKYCVHHLNFYKRAGI